MNKNEISVRELKEYFNTPSVVNRYLDEYDNKTVFDIDESYFYNVGSTVENALLVHDEELDGLYPEISREDIRDILKQHPKSHIYVGGKVSVRELKKYFGVDSVSYGVSGSPLKNKEIVYTYTGDHFYLHGDKIVVGIEKIPGLETEEISKDEISNSIVKELHRDTYLAEEIMDAYGLEKLLDSEGSSLKRCDIINLSEYEFIQGYWDKTCYRLIHRNNHTPNEYLRISGVKGLMEKFIIEKWDGYSGQKVRTVSEENKEGEKMVEGDNPISPSYYESDKIKLRDVLEQNLSRVKDGTLAFYLGNTWKYLWRWDRKENPIQDLNKAKKYIDFAIERLEESDFEERLDRIEGLTTKFADKIIKWMFALRSGEYLTTNASAVIVGTRLLYDHHLYQSDNYIEREKKKILGNDKLLSEIKKHEESLEDLVNDSINYYETPRDVEIINNYPIERSLLEMTKKVLYIFKNRYSFGYVGEVPKNNTNPPIDTKDLWKM